VIAESSAYATRRLVVVLCRPEQPRNVGSILRACANFGVDELVVVAPVFDWDEPENQRLITVASAGGRDFVHVVRCVATIAEALGCSRYVVGCTTRSRHNRELVALSAFSEKLSTKAEQYFPLALMFGCESQGLNSDEINHCHELLRIESTPEFSSLNIGHAVAVVLHCICLALRDEESRTACGDETVLSTVEDRERLIDLLGEESFPLPQSKSQMRSLLGRSCPTKDEMSLLYSLVRRRVK